jgi:hypothetical protein
MTASRLQYQIPVTTSGRIHPYHPNMRPRLSFRPVFSLLIVAIAVSAQTVASAPDSVAILSNNGNPMRVAYSCPEDDLQWAGLSCAADETCAIYLELNSVAATGRKIFAAGDLHSSSATLRSILLMSEDVGATWKEPAPRTRGSALDELQFHNAQIGWAAGETQYPLARDPFFLLTTDGGSSWRRQSVGEDDTPGLLQRFWFDSDRHGEAIVDAGKAAAAGRYLTWESQTGGESWTLTGKSNKLPGLLHAPLPDDSSEWRLAPSKDAKAFQIERRTDGRWTTVASFLIEVANCAKSGEPR